MVPFFRISRRILSLGLLLHSYILYRWCHDGSAFFGNSRSKNNNNLWVATKNNSSSCVGGLHSKEVFCSLFRAWKRGKVGPLHSLKLQVNQAYGSVGERTLQFAKMGVPYSTNRMKAPNNVQIPSGKLTWQWKNTSYIGKYIFKCSISHCYVHLPECNVSNLKTIQHEFSFMEKATEPQTFHPPLRLQPSHDPQCSSWNAEQWVFDEDFHRFWSWSGSLSVLFAFSTNWFHRFST